MKRILFILLISLLVLSCDKNDTAEYLFEEGTYSGTFQRELVWGESEVANVFLHFSDGQFNGGSDLPKYPAVGDGKYSITGDTINFKDDNFWTAEFDWSLILSGKYKFKVDGDKIEIIRDHRSATSDTYVDRYVLTKSEED